jgi:hypothetical protein
MQIHFRDFICIFFKLVEFIRLYERGRTVLFSWESPFKIDWHEWELLASNQCCGSGSLFSLWCVHFDADPDSTYQYFNIYLLRAHRPAFLGFFFLVWLYTKYKKTVYPTYHFDADPDPDPASSKSCESATTGLQTLHNSILSLNASIVSVPGPSWLHFEPPQLLNLMGIWILILLLTSMWIHADPYPDPQHCFYIHTYFTIRDIYRMINAYTNL